MEFYDIECKGRLVLEKLSSLPTYDKERDEGRLVYNETDHLLYYGKDEAWDVVTDLSSMDGSLSSHISDTSPHSATSAETASRLMIRDANGRARVAEPSHNSDIARKLDVDTVQGNVNTVNSGLSTHISANVSTNPLAPIVHGITASLIRQLVYPVGSVYIQFPGESTPASLFGGSWSRIFNTEGIYFRTEGGGATSFGGGVQGDAMRNLTGQFRVLSSSSRAIFVETGVSGVFGHANSIRSGNVSTSSSSYQGSTGINIDASRQVPTATEFRVKNRTIRIWKKTTH